ncbi:ACT domain-containing protein [Pseudooceanicola sp. 216_PA32_1]|uniref:ACT domain-containing protein n=1 Tax=Pseudooceanicola pacificus TaxID=2676438 RepID=A0A844VXY6_9RHOB|nr:ACT domain-containing protein [Pseudooceanicola pacificus]MWB76556.1 ACT domain-containing protein [Pseudooceanicola pacificus]
MPAPVSDTSAMIAGMDPVLEPGTWVFATSEDPALAAQAVALYREAEGTSLILPLEVAQAAGFDTSAPMRCITLRVNSSLLGVGLTAAVAGVLAAAGLPCNMVAGLRHDHAYVPAGQAETALALLRERATREAG